MILSINRIATFFSNDATKRERRERRSIEETKIKRLIKSIKNFKKISERDERFTDFNRTESLPTDKVFKSSPSSVNKCNQDFLQKNVLVLIAVCCFLLILTGCLICIVLPWNLWRYFKKRKEFSPNKWWMSGDDDIYDIGALLRQRKKYLQKQQLTFENNLLTPLLSVNTQYLPRKWIIMLFLYGYTILDFLWFFATYYGASQSVKRILVVRIKGCNEYIDSLQVSIL